MMLLYGAGYAAVYAVLALLYRHALGKAAELELDEIERFATRTSIGASCLHIAIAGLSITVALTLTGAYSGLAGWMYMLLGPALTVFHSVRARRQRILVSAWVARQTG